MQVNKDIYEQAAEYLQSRGLMASTSKEQAIKTVGWYAANAYLIIVQDGEKIGGVCLARSIDKDTPAEAEAFSHKPDGDTAWVQEAAADSKDFIQMFYFKVPSLMKSGKMKRLPKYFGWRRSNMVPRYYSVDTVYKHTRTNKQKEEQL